MKHESERSQNEKNLNSFQDKICDLVPLLILSKYARTITIPAYTWSRSPSTWIQADTFRFDIQLQTDHYQSYYPGTREQARGIHDCTWDRATTIVNEDHFHGWESKSWSVDLVNGFSWMQRPNKHDLTISLFVHFLDTFTLLLFTWHNAFSPIVIVIVIVNLLHFIST
jgi:hypothetical protein